MSRIPEEMTSRKIFLKLIKDVASSIKQLLDSLNELIEYLPYTHRPGKFLVLLNVWGNESTFHIDKFVY